VKPLSLMAAALLSLTAATAFAATADRPAATLLLPYFEVDLDHAGGSDAIVNVVNANGLREEYSDVTIWSSSGRKVYSFCLQLDRDGVQHIDLYELLVNGQLPQPVELTTPCPSPAPDPAAMRDALTNGGTRATGYVTISTYFHAVLFGDATMTIDGRTTTARLVPHDEKLPSVFVTPARGASELRIWRNAAARATGDLLHIDAQGRETVIATAGALAAATRVALPPGLDDGWLSLDLRESINGRTLPREAWVEVIRGDREEAATPLADAAATLLLPYFERDDTLTIVNTSASAQHAHATVWSDWGYPAMDFDIALAPRGAQSIALAGVLTPEAMAILTKGAASACPGVPVGEYQAWPAGYVTIDLVHGSAPGSPATPGYFANIAYDNVLTGISNDGPLVHIRAVDAPSRTFYETYSPEHADRREPLPSRFARRYSIALADETQLRVWLQPHTGAAARCDEYFANSVLPSRAFVAYDEHSDGTIPLQPTFRAANQIPGGLMPFWLGSGERTGWLDLDLGEQAWLAGAVALREKP
jgi:hypothetical protein